MKDFLTDFYNKVMNFFQSEKVEGENTKETAKNRLKLVLMQDRSNLEPETMAQLREELIEVISKYIVIDKEALGLNLDGDGESMALMLNIPVIRAKKPEEIREALEAAKSKQEETTGDLEEESDETVVEFSEGSIDEIDCGCDCDAECQCGCQEGEPCTCVNSDDAVPTESEEVEISESNEDAVEVQEETSEDVVEENTKKGKKNSK